MRIKFLTNDGASNFSQDLLPLIDRKRFDEILVCVSYLRVSGLQLVEDKLKDFLKAGGEISVLFGEDFNISEKEALQRLLDIGTDLRLFSKQGVTYHSKLWAFIGKSQVVTITGSSNLSHGALKGNIEANVMCEGNEVFLQEQVSYARHLFEDYSTVVDQKYIENYEDALVTRGNRQQIVSGGKLKPEKSKGLLRKYVDSWLAYVSRPDAKIGQEWKWRGWYFLPPHGSVDKDIMVQLQKVLAAMESSSEYRSRRKLLIDNTKHGLDNILRVQSRAGITYEHKYRPEDKRGLFVRQHKNYLIKLGFLEELPDKNVRITIEGQELIKAKNDSERRALYSRSLALVSWDFAPKTPFFKMLVQMVESLQDHRLYFDELSLFVMHTVLEAQTEDVLDLLNLYRSLSLQDQRSFVKDCEEKLGRLLDKYQTGTAFNHYQGKVRDLLREFGFAVGFSFHEGLKREDSYISLDSPKAARDVVAPVSGGN